MRCVFSAGLNGKALGWGAPPSGVADGRALAPVSAAWKRLARTIADDLVTTLFPGDCRLCGGSLTEAGRVPACNVCVARIAPQTQLLCGCCGVALDLEGVWFARQFAGNSTEKGVLCAICRRMPPAFARAVAYAAFGAELRELIHLLKYERMPGVAKLLGGQLASAMAEFEQEMPGGGVVVAVPLHRAKRSRRGYNQAELLAAAAVRSLRRPSASTAAWKLKEEHGALVRVRDTASQYALAPRARRQNLADAFEVARPHAVAGRKVLLIDDVYTSGATARACARALREAGAATVFVATLSRAQPELVASWDDGAAPAQRSRPAQRVEVGA